MKTSRKAALPLVVLAGVLGPIGVASSAQAGSFPNSVVHDTCIITLDKPKPHGLSAFSGLVDYPYHVDCKPSAAGLTVEVELKRWESDLATRPGDPDTAEDFTGKTTHNLKINAAGEVRHITSTAALPFTDDTDHDEEVYLAARFRVKNGGVTGTWSAKALSQASDPIRHVHLGTAPH